MYFLSKLSGKLKIFSGPMAAPNDIWEWEEVQLEKMGEKKKHGIIFRGLFNFYYFSELSRPLKIFSGPKAAPNYIWEGKRVLLGEIVEN